VLPLFLIAFLILGAAAVAMLGRNLIHSALLLVLSWAGIAAFYLWAGAEFVAFAQVLIYVGAVSMVVLFAVLLTRQGAVSAPAELALTLRLSLGFLTAGSVAGLLISAVLDTPLAVTTKPAPTAVPVKELGALLMGPHAPALLITGVILTVALLGAIVIAAGPRDPARPEDAP